MLACVLVGSAWFTVAVLSAFRGQPPAATGAGPRPAASADGTSAGDPSSSDPASSSSSPGTTGSTRPAGVALVVRRIGAAATTAGLVPGSPTVTTRRDSHPDEVSPTTGVTSTTADPAPTTTTAPQEAPPPSTPEPTRPTR